MKDDLVKDPIECHLQNATLIAVFNFLEPKK